MNNTSIIKIGDVEYKVRKTYASLLRFEEITGRGVNELKDNITDLLTLFYCILVTGNIHFNYTFGEFIELLDEHQEAVEAFNNHLSNEMQSTTTEPPKKKKVKKH